MALNKKLILAFALGITCTLGSQALLNSSAKANQPFMEAALASLRAARANLVQAEPNKGGHRERAIELVDNAIGQTEAGIAYAR